MAHADRGGSLTWGARVPLHPVFMADPASRPPNCAPLVHPRRDPLLMKARIAAAGVCAVANGGMFWLGLYGVMNGAPLNLATIAVFVVSLVVVGTRLPILVELFLGILDRDEHLDSAPTRGEVLSRLAVGVALPWMIATFALTRLGDLETGFWALIGLLLLDVVYRFGGFAGWRGPRIGTEILRAVFAHDAERGALAFAQSVTSSPREFETGALVVASLAIRRGSRHVLDVLLGVTQRRLAEPGAAENPHLRRTLLILEADRARMDDVIAASEPEARALRETGAGHPRRLSLALFVATAALDTDQPRAAIDALSRLHSRDVMPSTARVVVNWLLREAARRAGDEALAERCRNALATFNLRREAGAISTGQPGEAPQDDPYSRWIQRAKEELQHGPAPG